MPLPNMNSAVSCEAWLLRDDAEHSELIDGRVVMMAPPSQRHQEISGELFGQLWSFLKGKPCKVFHAPFGVRLNASDDTVFQPDLFVVCDVGKLNGRLCAGAPDLIVEILSPGTARTDKLLKFNRYQAAGVREYWLIDPETDIVQVCTLRDGFYATAMYAESDRISVRALPGCEVDLSAVFAE